MNKIYYMDDILDGEFEYQTVREVLSNNRMNILNLCNKGYFNFYNKIGAEEEHGRRYFSYSL